MNKKKQKQKNVNQNLKWNEMDKRMNWTDKERRMGHCEQTLREWEKEKIEMYGEDNGRFFLNGTV